MERLNAILKGMIKTCISNDYKTTMIKVQYLLFAQ